MSGDGLPQDGYALSIWQDNLDLANAALFHPWIRALGDGTLPTCAALLLRSV